MFCEFFRNIFFFVCINFLEEENQRSPSARHPPCLFTLKSGLTLQVFVVQWVKELVAGEWNLMVCAGLCWTSHRTPHTIRTKLWNLSPFVVVCVCVWSLRVYQALEKKGASCSKPIHVPYQLQIHTYKYFGHRNGHQMPNYYVFLHFLRAVSQMNRKNKCDNLGNNTFDASDQENNDA